MKKLVYICSPYKAAHGRTVAENVRNANLFCRYAYESGVIPIAPHTIFTQFLDDDKADERADGLAMGCQLLSLCAECWVFGDISSGMAAEINKAKELGLPVRMLNDSLRAQ